MANSDDEIGADAPTPEEVDISDARGFDEYSLQPLNSENPRDAVDRLPKAVTEDNLDEFRDLMTIIPEHVFNTLWQSLHRNQRRYVMVRPNCSSNAAAARKIGISQSAVSQWGEHVDVFLEVWDYITLQEIGGFQKRAVLMAKNTMQDLQQSDDERIQFKASKYILDHHLGKPTQKNEHVVQTTPQSVRFNVKE